MGNIKIRQGAFDTQLALEHAGVRAGFPSPADDYRHETLDFNRDYIRHPEASFYGDVEGDSMRDAGILDGDRVIIDRAVEPHQGSIVVAYWNGEFTIKFLDLTHKKDGYIELRPANPDYPVFKVEAGDSFEIWGVAIHLIRTFEKFEPLSPLSLCDSLLTLDNAQTSLALYSLNRSLHLSPLKTAASTACES